MKANIIQENFSASQLLTLWVSVTKVGEKWDRVPFAIPVAMFLV
jgi:hypothetical protein